MTTEAPRTGRRRTFTDEEIARAIGEHGPGRTWEAIAADLGHSGLGLSLKRRCQEFRAGAKAPGTPLDAPGGATVVEDPTGAPSEPRADPRVELLIAEVRDLSDRVGRLEAAEALRTSLDRIPLDVFDDQPAGSTEESDEPADLRPVDPRAVGGDLPRDPSESSKENHEPRV